MEELTGLSPDRPAAGHVSWAHGVWFCVTFLFGLAFIAVLPVFQTNDEDSHWRRVWTVAVGDVYCHKIPEVANNFHRVIKFDAHHDRGSVARTEYIKEALGDRGYNIPSPFTASSCAYFPLGYVPAAVVARLVAFTLYSRPRVGGMICGYYAARLANWLMVTLGVFLLFRAVPWARSLTLFFYSIPEVLQQSVAVNLDSFLFFMSCLLLICLFRPARWRSVAFIVLIATLMSMTKPIYAPLGLLALPLIATLSARQRPAWRGWLTSVSLLFPPIAWRLWVKSIPRYTLNTTGPTWVNPTQQIAFIKSHPGRLFVLLWAQLKDTFGGNLMHGTWTSIFGAFGWSTFEMKRVGYYLLLLALALAVAADWGSPAVPTPINGASGWKRRVIWALTVLAPLIVIVGVIFAMYLYYTKVGENSVNGVQGRYYLVPLLVLALLGVYALKRRRPPPGRLQSLAPHLVWAAACLCAIADGLAVVAIKNFYWVS